MRRSHWLSQFKLADGLKFVLNIFILLGLYYWNYTEILFTQFILYITMFENELAHKYGWETKMIAQYGGGVNMCG